jgi:hypothetical protein
MAMTLQNNAPANFRFIQDTNYIATASLAVPATQYLAASGSTAALDLVQAVPYPVTEKIIVNVAASALTNLSGSTNVNIALQHSATNVSANFVNIPELASPLVRVTGTSTNTGATTQDNVLLPPSVKRYVRAYAYSETSASLAGGITGSYGVTFYF